ncbi:hypothetical protein, partial [Pseudomonas monteilii]|uniref:hypothetical protein n=1 Tax=Pseudomonas monteilii TaxID=76759 RepID=UPI0036EE0CF7
MVILSGPVKAEVCQAPRGEIHTRRAQQGGDYSEVRRRRTPWEMVGGITGLFAGSPALIKQNATHCFLSTQAATSWYPSFRALRSKAR